MVEWGFIDMGLFNQLLLAKKAGRLHDCTETLAVRVMKGMVFPVEIQLGQFNPFVDAGVRTEARAMGLGAVLSNVAGSILFSTAALLVFYFEPLISKAAALLHGLRLCLQMGYFHVKIFSDCLRLVQSVGCKEIFFS
uniref:RNase H type-1 domain-containing protein n=1 Tax=Cannabis sativa TaxID=3483 RepID=A0A803QS77_CANSA